MMPRFSVAVAVAIVMALFVAAASPVVAQSEQEAPHQLNTDAFSKCLQADMPKEDLKEVGGHLRLGHLETVQLASYLALYPAQTRGWSAWLIQKRAFKRWSKAYWDVEAVVAEKLQQRGMDDEQKHIYPAQVWRDALDACETHRKDVTHNPVCAAVVLHNVFRAVGRWRKYIDADNKNKSYLPTWYTKDAEMWQKTWQRAVHRKLISLQRDGGGENYGPWYHMWGIMAYGSVSYIKYGASASSSITKVLASMNAVVNPYINGNTLSPEKARLDKDFAELSWAQMRQFGEGPASSYDAAVCRSRAGYVMPAEGGAVPCTKSDGTDGLCVRTNLCGATDGVGEPGVAAAEKGRCMTHKDASIQCCA